MNKTLVYLKKILPAFVIGLASGFILFWIINPSANNNTCVNPYEYNIEELRKDPPEPRLYEKTYSILTDLTQINALAITDNKIAAAGNKKIVIQNLNTKHLTYFEIPEPGRAMCFITDEHLIIAFNSYCAVFNNNGKELYRYPDLGPKALITSIALWGDDLAIADAQGKQVFLFNQQRRLTGIIGKKADEYVIPSAFFDILPVSQNEIWIVDPGHHKLELYNRENKLIRSWSDQSDSFFIGCCNPIHLALTPNNLLAAAEKGIERIRLFDNRGKYQGYLAGPSDFQQGDIISDMLINRNLAAVSLQNSGIIYIFKPKIESE